METMVGGLDELAVADNFPPEILVERVEEAGPVVAAVVLPPPAAEDVPRRIIRGLREQPMEAVEMARRHVLGRLHFRPDSGQVKVFQ